MKLFLFLLLLCPLANATCHVSPDADDRAFYDKAVISSAKQFTWTGQAANQFAASVIFQRRASFYGQDYAQSGPAFDAEESALWDALVIAALEKSTRTTGTNATWTGYYVGSEWAHVIAWDAMYYRMTTKCP